MTTSADGWLQMPSDLKGGEAAKPAAYLPVYERYLERFRDRAFALLEVGIWRGDSLRMWGNTFPSARIIGVDLNPPGDVSWPPNVTTVGGDQSDPEVFREIRASLAPDGFDVVIDDASHFGELSAATLAEVFPNHLKPGGVYFIEDWGTGYWATWPDGADPTRPLARRVDVSRDGAGHWAGMVGLVKQLVDHVGSGDIHKWPGADSLPVKSMAVYPGLVVLEKA